MVGGKSCCGMKIGICLWASFLDMGIGSDGVYGCDGVSLGCGEESHVNKEGKC